MPRPRPARLQPVGRRPAARPHPRRRWQRAHPPQGRCLHGDELMRSSRPAPRGQVLVIVAIGITILLALAGVAIDVGRLMAERRHLQTAADAGALAACQSLISGAVADINVAAQRARNVANVNIDGSPAGAVATMSDPPVYEDEDGSGFLDPDELKSGVVVSGSSAPVAISPDMDDVLGALVGGATFHL